MNLTYFVVVYCLLHTTFPQYNYCDTMLGPYAQAEDCLAVAAVHKDMEKDDPRPDREWHVRVGCAEIGTPLR